jgi:hypothetical protein
MLGHSHPSWQLAQQAHSQSQSGQPSQQSPEEQQQAAAFEQQELASVAGFSDLADVPAMPAAISPLATNRPPNNFVNMEYSLSDECR